jgi:hypothetical protein
MKTPKREVPSGERGSVMPALMVATTSVAALAAAYLTKVAADVSEARGRDTAMRASQNAVANLEIARNIVNASPYDSVGNRALLAAMSAPPAGGRRLLPGCPVEAEVEELGDGWFMLRTFGEESGVRKVAQATVRASLPITNYNYFVAQQKLGISGEPRGMIHSNDSIDFYFANGRYRDPISAVNGFGYRAGATTANTQLLGTSNGNAARKNILDNITIADVAAQADTLRVDDYLISEVTFQGSTTKVDLYRPQMTVRSPYMATVNVFSHYTTVTQWVNTPIYRTENYTVTLPVYQTQAVTRTVSTPVYGTRSVTVTERTPVYGWTTVLVTVTRQRWVEFPPAAGAEGAGDVSGGGSLQGRWESYQVQEPRQQQIVINWNEAQVTRNETYIIRYDNVQQTTNQQVQVGTRTETRTRTVVDRYEMQPRQVQQAVYVPQQVQRFRDVVLPEQFLESRTVASSGILYFTGPVRKLSGRINGRMTVVTNETARITGSVQYVDSSNRTRMLNGTNENLPYDPNPDYNGSSTLAIMARDDVLYSANLPARVEINGALITTQGTVAFEGLQIAANGETVTHQIAGGFTAASYQKESIRRLGGIVSRERPVATYVDGNNNLVAGFRRGRSTMDQAMTFTNGGGIAPPGVMAENRPVWGVTMLGKKLDSAAIRGGL